jgi:hypothetical protein
MHIMNLVWLVGYRLKPAWEIVSKGVLRPALALISCMVISTFAMLLPDTTALDFVKLGVWVVVFPLMFALMANLGAKYMKSLGS